MITIAFFEGTMAQIIKLSISICLLMILLAGCGDPVLDQIERQLPVTEQRLNQLKSAISDSKVSNAVLISEYADRLKQQKPHLSNIIDELAKESNTSGRLYNSLIERFNLVKSSPDQFANSQERYDELLSIIAAADPTLFSDALSDPLNVLADMSDGELARVNALSKAQSMAANGAQDFGVGEQLIGNPLYGSWQQDSSGMSFWAWYGVFSLIDDVFDYKRKKRYYSHWGKYRSYSYYNDVGRYNYSSPKQKKFSNQLNAKTRKSFERKGQKFTSPYGKTRTGSTKLSGQSMKAQSASSRFATKSQFSKKSSYGKKSSYSKNASFRNSKTSTSRSFRRGK